MKKDPKIDSADFLNRFTLVVGDINSGKTTLTGAILDNFCRNIGGVVTVIDLAPEIRIQDLGAKFSAKAVGGKLEVPISKTVRYYHEQIHAPRLRARDENEARKLAAENVRTIDALFSKAAKRKSDAIFVNDCSLYLHCGSASKLLKLIRSSPTSVVNGYFGRFFNDSSISIHERKEMENLMDHCDRLVRLPVNLDCNWGE